MTTMTRHERCRAALAGRPVDRTPTYLPAISCAVASKLLGRKAYGGTGSLHYAEVLAWARGEQAHQEFEEQLFQDMRDVQRALDIDVMRMPWRINRRPTKQLDENTFLFGNPEGVHSVWAYHPPSGDFGVVREVTAYDSPEQWLQETLASEEAAAVNAETSQQKARAGHLAFAKRFGEEFFTISMQGMITAGIDETSLIALALEPELCARRMMAQAQWAITWGRWLLGTGLPTVMLGGGDMATNKGPIYSPESFRQVLLPAYRKTAEELNPLGVHCAFRSDGNLGIGPGTIGEMLFAEAKVPGYAEVDRDAGMTIERLRKAYPELVIWGHVSSAFLASATPQQVKDECHRILDANGPSRYFHSCSNAILQGTPVENVVAMYEVRG
ncbi:MAG: hypothetical protein FWD61_04620 [Phycisphaerales bacterium]|nr:hypothetical protein [Phycisphaerales bacterium]